MDDESRSMTNSAITADSGYQALLANIASVYAVGFIIYIGIALVRVINSF